MTMPRLSEPALKRLEDARARSDELARQLSDPATFGDARRAAELGREQAELADVISNYARYRELAMRLDEATRYRKPDAGAGAHRLGGEKRIEHARADIVRNAGPVVGNFDNNKIAIGRRAYANPPRLRLSLQGLLGIDQKVGQNLGHLVGIAEDGRQAGGERLLYLDAG